MWAGAMVAGLVALAGLGACSVELQNTRAAQEMARRSELPGSVYTGWRVFQDRCAACHGPDALGTTQAPDLLARVRDLGSRRFVSLVLQRYDWSHPAVLAAAEGAAREALVDDVLLRRQGALAMPAWEGEPRVSAHIADLYVYLSARAEGRQGTGRPAP